MNKIFKIGYISKGIGYLIIASALSCSPLKYVPKDKYLLNKVEIEVDNPDINKEEAKSHIRQKENYKILGFVKFHLWLYNLSSKRKNDNWLKRIGEPPEIYDPALVEASENRLRQYLDSKGYFRAKISPELSLKEKRSKASLVYSIKTGEQYKIKEVNYHFGDSALKSAFYEDSLSLNLSRTAPFDFNLLEDHREKIVESFKNKGYYYFTNDDISYLADSSKFEKTIILDAFIGDSVKQDSL